MRWPLPVLLALLVLLPAVLVCPALAADGNKVGYVSFNRVQIELAGGDARIEVDYALDPGMPLIIMLFGGGDLQKKVERSLNFPSLRPEEVGLTHAVFSADGAAQDYGNGAFWFPVHDFGATFPLVQVKAPGYSMTYRNADSVPDGFGYFAKAA